MKILIADDDAVSRFVLTKTLKHLGYEIVAAVNGQEALKLYETDPVPIVITDLAMPILDGLEVCRRIRGFHRGKYTYIICLTSAETKEGFLSAMDAGADDYLTKPLDEQQMAARLRVARRILALQDEVKRLRIRTCCYCKKILNEHGSWVTADLVTIENLPADLSHGICPECWQTHAEQQIQAFRQRQGRESG